MFFAFSVLLSISLDLSNEEQADRLMIISTASKIVDTFSLL